MKNTVKIKARISARVYWRFLRLVEDKRPIDKSVELALTRYVIETEGANVRTEKDEPSTRSEAKVQSERSEDIFTKNV